MWIGLDKSYGTGGACPSATAGAANCTFSGWANGVAGAGLTVSNF